MHPANTSRKRKSDQISVGGDEPYAIDMASQKISIKGGSPHPEESPAKRQRVGITLAQKQALIDNLQLEITERARKLRANYSIHAQSLRTRIEIRVNRIPLSLRRLTMGELMEKYSGEEQPKASATASSVRGPPVPAKDKAPSRPPTRGAMAPPSARSMKRHSHEISGGDKENEMQTPQKKMRANTTTERNPTHVLSPTTNNSRVAPRTAAATASAATPARAGIARPAVMPGRAVMATSVLNKMVDGSRSTTRPPTSTAVRKTMTTTTTSTTSSAHGTVNSTASSSSAAAARRKRGATTTATFHPPAPPSSSQPSSSQPTTTAPRPATRTARRASGASESSEGSTATVIRKRPMTAPPGAQPKPPPTITAAKRTTVVGSVKKSGISSSSTTTTTTAAAAAAAFAAGGTATGRKTPVAPTPAGTVGKAAGRVLRKRA